MPGSVNQKVVVVGGGPAGLMAAERLIGAGFSVHLYDAKPSVGRKFLIAGKGGMNLTHSEPFEAFVSRYADRSGRLEPLLKEFGPEQMRGWAKGLGVETFVGSSGRVFPLDMKAAPLLRGWVRRLRQTGVVFHTNHRWLGWNSETDQSTTALFQDASGEQQVVAYDALILALGGGSWAKLGSDGLWLDVIRRAGVVVHDLEPANCGFEVTWSPYMHEKFAGHPLKQVDLCCENDAGELICRRGEFVVSESGIEGSLVYAQSRLIRRAIQRGESTAYLDLTPDLSTERLRQLLLKPWGSKTVSSILKSRLNIHGVKAALLRECAPQEAFKDTTQLVAYIKRLPLAINGARPIDEAISTAGGVCFNELNEQLMLRSLPGVFCAGEMLDWEAPTGGYLFTASFSTGRAAAAGVIDYLGLVSG